MTGAHYASSGSALNMFLIKKNFKIFFQISTKCLEHLPDKYKTKFAK